MKWLSDYQQSFEALQQMLIVINAIIHFLFAGAVANDCGKLSKQGLKPILVSPATWAFTTLIGGVYIGAIYWFLHHSTLTRYPGKQIKES
jgi:hypothetical protein